MNRHSNKERAMNGVDNTTAAERDYPLVYRNLMAVGLLGAVYRKHEDSDTVSDAVELTLNDAQHFRICRAIAQGMGGNGLAAKEALGRHVEDNPDDDGAKVALGVALMLSGDSDWQHWIDNVLATSSDQVAREAATGVLTYLKRLLH
jgi:Flp pilus assembly protein TadD